MSALELVLTTGLFFPIAGGLFFLAMRGAKLFYQMITTLVGWPHL